MYYFAIAKLEADTLFFDPPVVQFFDTKAEAEAGLRDWFKKKIGKVLISNYMRETIGRSKSPADPYVTTDVDAGNDKDGSVLPKRKTSVFIRAVERFYNAGKYDPTKFDEKGLPHLEDMENFINKHVNSYVAVEECKIVLPTQVAIHCPKGKRARVEE